MKSLPSQRLLLSTLLTILLIVSIFSSNISILAESIKNGSGEIDSVLQL